MSRLHPTDFIAAIGLALLTAGAAMVFVPAAFITCGALLLLYAVALSRNENPEESEP